VSKYLLIGGKNKTGLDKFSLTVQGNLNFGLFIGLLECRFEKKNIIFLKLLISNISLWMGGCV
jgi:hypothetical protein